MQDTTDFELTPAVLERNRQLVAQAPAMIRRSRELIAQLEALPTAVLAADLDQPATAAETRPSRNAAREQRIRAEIVRSR
ncbi:hypothetical protein [Nocardia niwae]|uniref:hypothetical protein n=1 Tax=Nocardia niwae TaxID=626084 RepID=UPI0033CD59F5